MGCGCGFPVWDGLATLRSEGKRQKHTLLSSAISPAHNPFWPLSLTSRRAVSQKQTSAWLEEPSANETVLNSIFFFFLSTLFHICSSHWISINKSVFFPSLDSKWWIFVHSYCVCMALSAAFPDWWWHILISQMYLSLSFPLKSISCLLFLAPLTRVQALAVIYRGADHGWEDRDTSLLIFMLLSSGWRRFWTDWKARGSGPFSDVIVWECGTN